MADSPEDFPAFMDPKRAEAIGYVGAPDALPTFDDELDSLAPDGDLVIAAPSRGLISRYQEIARLHAHGKTNNEICALLGYTASRMSLILKDPYVQKEIQTWRDRFIGDDSVSIMREAARDGARRLHGIILDPNARDSTAMDASKFVIEQSLGKAKQSVAVENVNLSSFMELIKGMQLRGEPLDVTPTGHPELPAPQQAEDQWGEWITKNI